MKTVILLEDKSEEMFPLENTPKLLIPVLNQPLINYLKFVFKDSSDEVTFIFNDNEYSQKVKDYISNQNWPFQVNFIHQNEASNLIPENEKFFPKYSWDLLKLQEKLITFINFDIKGEVEGNVHIKGRVALGKGSIIKSGTYIEGDVVIGENTVIGPNAYIRGTSVIGDNCKVGFSVEIKNSILFSNTHIPHLSCFGDSIIGSNVNCAAGSKVANLRHDETNIKSMIKGELVDTGTKKFGTIIGDNVKLGINTIIYPGRKLGSNTTTLPGEVIKEDKN